MGLRYFLEDVEAYVRHFYIYDLRAPVHVEPK
jgi:hypothetical protein